MNLTKVMTYASMCWLRFEKNCDVVCTEIGSSWLKDVFGVWIHVEDGLPAISAEIEIKSSMSDLNRDFDVKRGKHFHYSEGRNCPTYMYYVVPESLSDKAVKVISARNKNYGVMSFNAEAYLDRGLSTFIGGNTLTCIHRPRRLTEDRPKPSVMHRMGRRIMNEYFSQMNLILNKSWNIECEIKEHSQELAKILKNPRHQSWMYGEAP